MNTAQIPPPYSRPGGVTAKIRALGIGDCVEIPRNRERAAHGAARRIGFKLVARRLGKPDATTFWRVE